MPEYPLLARDALIRLAKRGHRINTIIDVGASTGQWSANASYVWPHSHFLLIEANEHHRPALEHCRQQAPNRIEYVLAAATDHSGKTYLYTKDDPFGGTVVKTLDNVEQEVAAVTIDELIAQRSLPDPYLIKLDTHGHELEILRGAHQTLPRTGVLVIEAYFHRINDSAPLFHELCAFLAERGFGCIDIIEPLWRPYDHAIWQIDLVFVPLTSKEFQYRLYA